MRTSLTSLWRDRHWQMFDREPIPNWVDGRFGVLGDAAHPMLQYLAQGANQAIEDAQVLATEAGQHTSGGEVDWTTEVQRTARSWGDLWHVDGIGRSMRNELLTNRDIHDYQHIDWLYGL
ncbi:FAD-dependent monooxygenase [Parasphingorhabdus pacifica]